MSETAKSKDNSTEPLVDEQWRKNHEFFWQHAEEFKEKYPGKYVAVHDGEVLGVGEDLGDLVGNLLIKYGNIPIYADNPEDENEIEIINWPIIE